MCGWRFELTKEWRGNISYLKILMHIHQNSWKIKFEEIFLHDRNEWVTNKWLYGYCPMMHRHMWGKAYNKGNTFNINEICRLLLLNVWSFYTVICSRFTTTSKCERFLQDFLASESPEKIKKCLLSNICIVISVAVSNWITQ